MLAVAVRVAVAAVVVVDLLRRGAPGGLGRLRVGGGGRGRCGGRRRVHLGLEASDRLELAVVEEDPAAAVAQWKRARTAEAAHALAVVNDIRSQQSSVDFASAAVALQAVRRLSMSGN